MTEPTQTTPPGGPDHGHRPPQSWEEWVGNGAAGHGYGGPRMPDLSPLFALLDALRRLVPPELQEQFNALQRELLLTVRALIDWQLERLDGPAGGPEVEDIPID